MAERKLGTTCCLSTLAPGAIRPLRSFCSLQVSPVAGRTLQHPCGRWSQLAYDNRRPRRRGRVRGARAHGCNQTDEVAVFEMPVRNSGHWVGKFADKRRMKNPDTRTWFKLEDLVVGKVVTIAAQPLLITRADEHCLQFLEGRPHQFPYSDPVACSVKLAPLKGEPEMHDADGVDPDRLKELAHTMGIDIIDHEIITLLRKFGMGDSAAPKVHGPSVLETAGA